MRLFDYVNVPEELKREYFDTFQMQVGLRYFGGKNTIGKYLVNRIFEMQAYRYMLDNPALIFIDAFCGGGKMALSIPTGWFNTIVMNDLNYGVASFYKSCQNNPRALIRMVEILGDIMCEGIFRLCAENRSQRGKSRDPDFLKKLGLADKNESENPDFDEILSGAMTFWVTQGSWLGETDPATITYTLSIGDKNEKQEIEKRVKIAQKRIMQINQKMTCQEIIVENMDYIELIKKYSGKDNVIWYFDPPYHAATLNKSNGFSADGKKIERKNARPAPYEDSFKPEDTRKMTEILTQMKWFIKSDYDPKYFFKPDENYYHDFDALEDKEKGFYKELLGFFHKGTSSGNDEGMEVIWSRYDGSKESLQFMGDIDTQNNSNDKSNSD